MTYEKGHHDIAELATRRLKKYAKESGNAKLLIARPLLGSDSFRDSIPFVHAIIKDVLVSDPLGYSVSGQEINNYLRKVLDAVVFNIPPHRSAKWDQIDMFEKRLKNNNWPGIWSGETQAAQIIDILVKAIISDRPGEPVVSVTTLDADLRRAMKDHRHFKELLPQSVPTPITRVGDHESRIKIAAFRTHYLEFLIRYLDGLASQTKDVS
jgi:hypothetical protein